MYSWQFSKHFPLPKNGGHFEFSNFLPEMQKHRFASISLTVRDRAISSKFSSNRLSKQSTLANFQKFFLSLKVTEFEFLPKMEKHKLASISLTIDVQSLLATLSKNRFPATFGGHLEFLHKIQKRIYLGNGAR